MYLRYEEFAKLAVERLGWSPSRCNWSRWCRSGALPAATKIGGIWAVPKLAVERFLSGMPAG